MSRALEGASKLMTAEAPAGMLMLQIADLALLASVDAHWPVEIFRCDEGSY